MKSFYQKVKTPLWLIISGLLTSLTLIITEIGFLQWISLIPMALVLMRAAENSEKKLRRLYGMGVLFFLAYYAVSFHWFFYMYPLDFAGLSNGVSLAVVLLACLGLGLLQAVQSALLFLVYGLVARSSTIKNHKIIAPFLAASLWVIFEWWQTIGWWGVPWARMPLGQIDFILLVRSASLFGSYFITFIIVAVNFCLGLAISNGKIEKLGVIAAASLFCLNLVLGLVITLSYKESGEKVKVAAIQGNISSKEKWDIGLFETMDVYSTLTENAVKDGADIVVWPETALPCVLFDDMMLTNDVSELASSNDATIILSTFTEDEETFERYNSIIEVTRDGSFGEDIYSKQRLVPFGEFVPMRGLVSFLFPPLADIGMLDEDLTPGESSVIIESEYGKIGSGICFDSIYETVILNAARNGAEFIVISTNDSWFSDSAALDMHNSQSRLRAIETGRYVVRSANTGISSVIDPLGHVIGELGADERGYVIADITPRTQITLYTVIGNMIVYLCAAFVLFMIIIRVKNAVKSEVLKNS